MMFVGINVRATRGSAPLRPLARRYEGPGAAQVMDTSTWSSKPWLAAVGSPVDSGTSQSANATRSAASIRRRVLNTVSPLRHLWAESVSRRPAGYCQTEGAYGRPGAQARRSVAAWPSHCRGRDRGRIRKQVLQRRAANNGNGHADVTEGMAEGAGADVDCSRPRG